MGRIFGAILRAIVVVVVVAAPSFLVPDGGVHIQEISLVVGALAGAFIFFEYASSHPGLIDFRFSPPYNRFRFALLAAVVFTVTFYARARVGADPFSPQLLAVAEALGRAFDFRLSPVSLAVNMLGPDASTEFRDLIRGAAALSLSIATAMTVLFVILLWLFKWPARRRNFNLWINLPTFEPSSGRDVERRLNRNGKLQILVGVAAPFYMLIIASRAGGWFDPSVLDNPLSLVWASVLWTVVSALLVIRGAALMKIARLIEKARRY